MIQEIFFYVGSSLAILLAILKICEKFSSLKKGHSKKPEIKINSFEYSFGCRERTKKEKEDLKWYGGKLPDVVPYLSFRLRLINISKKENVVDLYVYTIKDGKRLNFGGKNNIILEPMKPVEIKIENMVFNWTNEHSFWENSGWSELKDKGEIMSLFYKIKLDAISIYVEDAHSKKTILKLPLYY